MAEKWCSSRIVAKKSGVADWLSSNWATGKHVIGLLRDDRRGEVGLVYVFGWKRKYTRCLACAGCAARKHRGYGRAEGPSATPSWRAILELR